MQVCYIWSSSFREEVVRKCGWTTDDGGCLSFKLTRSLRLRGAKKFLAFIGMAAMAVKLPG